MKTENMTIDPVILMSRAKAGDNEAFALLYESYFTPIYRYILIRVKNVPIAEDLTQAVFLKVLEKISAYENKQRPPLAYFFTVARNKVIDFWRRRRDVSLSETEDWLNIAAESWEADKELAPWETKQLINNALDILSSDQRDAVILRYLNELTFAEIAAAMGKREEAIRQLVSRGIKNLRSYFANK